MPHISDTKKKLVASLAKLIKAYPIVGAVDLQGMPSAQLQKMRSTLRNNNVEIIMAKRRIIKLAIENSKSEKQGIEEIEKNLQGMPSLIFGKTDSFKLYKLLKQSKSPAAAKPGQIAPKDIIIKAGPTSFTPGPIISELAKSGIKAGVEAGKIVIKQDAVVCKEGQKITPQIADLLSKFNIKPMEIGLNLTATYENGVIFKKSVLDVDEDKLKEQITQAAQESFNLSVEAGYFTKENIEVIVKNVFYSCKALAEESKFLADVVVEDMLAGAERSAKSVKSEANIPDSENKEDLEKKEEKVLEEVKEIIKEEKKVEAEPIKEEASVEKEVAKAEKEIKEKELEAERIEAEKEVEKIETKKQESQDNTDAKVAKMVEEQKKRATGEHKKESAEALVDEAKSNDKSIKEVEDLVHQLQKGKPLTQKPASDHVPTAAELAARKRK